MVRSTFEFGEFIGSHTLVLSSVRFARKYTAPAVLAHPTVLDSHGGLFLRHTETRRFMRSLYRHDIAFDIHYEDEEAAFDLPYLRPDYEEVPFTLYPGEMED